MSEERFDGRVAIITGAARGLGFVLARSFAQRGAAVVLADLEDAAVGRAAAAILESTPDARVAVTAGDLSRQDPADAMAAAALAAFGRIDILVNNAGGGVIRPFLDHSEETLQATIDRNLWTVLRATRAVLPPMLERNYGRIVNIGADSVRNGLPSHAAYNAAKGGVHGLTTGLAREFAERGITVNTVAPGGILTPEVREMLDPQSAGYSKYAIQNINELLTMYPMRRFAEMEEVAAMTMHLAAEMSRYVTGQVISVNGGSTML